MMGEGTHYYIYREGTKRPPSMVRTVGGVKQELNNDFTLVYRLRRLL